MTIELALLISIVSVSFSIFFGLKNSKKSDVKDIEDRVARDTKTDMKLDEISKDVKEVKETVRNIQNDVKDHEGRIVKVEASYKRLHERVDDSFDKLAQLERKLMGNE
jgi:peptidoglycan hydrolase CwlO-like protein